MTFVEKLVSTVKRRAKPVDEASGSSAGLATRRQWVAGAAIGGTALVAEAALRPTAALAQSSGFVDTTSNQTIGGVKTFTQPPLVPAGALPVSAVADLVSDLAAKAPVTGPFAPSTPGATAATRYVGGTAGGAPTTGSFAVGDFVIDHTGKAWICTVAGTPGTWVQQAGVDTSSDQIIGGVKTFTAPPVVPADAFPEAAVAGLTADLSAKQDVIPPGTYVGTDTLATRTRGLTQIPDPTEVAISIRPVNAGDTFLHNFPGPERVIEFRYGTSPGITAPYDLGSYFGSSGAYATGSSVLVSNKRMDINGAIQGVSALLNGGEPSMVAISTDINGPALAIESGIASNANCTAIAIYSLDAIAGGATPYSQGYGTKKWAIDDVGKMYWGFNLGTTPAASALLTIARNTGESGRLDIASPSQPVICALMSPTGRPVALRAYIGGARAFEIASANVGSGYWVAGASVVFRFYQGQVAGWSGMAIGGADRPDLGTLAVLANRADLPALAVRRFAAGTTADIAVILDQTDAVLHRFNRAGYSITRKKAAPADADLKASEGTWWLDDTPGAAKAMFKAKDSAGTVRTGWVALA